MRVTIALAVLAGCISLGGCSRPDHAAYAEPRPLPPPHEAEMSAVKQTALLVTKPQEPVKRVAVKPPPLPPKKPPQPANASVHAPGVADATFAAAQEKAKRRGVHTLTEQDIEGLSAAQITALRGY